MGRPTSHPPGLRGSGKRIAAVRALGSEGPERLQSSLFIHMVYMPDGTVGHSELRSQGRDDLPDAVAVNVDLVRMRGVASGINNQAVMRPASA